MRYAVALFVVIACSPAAMLAQETAPVRSRVRVPHTIPAATGAIAVDGIVNDEAWKDALRLELNFEVRPGENIPPPVRTEMLVTHDGKTLFVAFKCYDAVPSAIRARFSDRDSAFNDDFVGIVLDTFNDERRAYEFFSNPLGVQMDMLMDDVSGDEDEAWNAIWDAAGRITAEGYEVEFAIPFTQLRFEAANGPQTWGIDGIRSYPRRDRHHITLFPRIRGENTYLGQEDKIAGFAGVRPGQNMEIVPTVTAVRSDARAALPCGALENVRSEGDLGLTAKWGVTPNVTLNATVNPDFSQVEADAVQLDVNNTFALFFPETRPFFLEGSDFFRTSRLNLVYTRRIAQPDGALKISGKTGRHSFGAFSAHDDTTVLILPGVQRSRTELFDPGTTASVGRYRFDVGRNSTVGAMVTDRRGGGYVNSVLAIDTRHRFSAADSVSVTLANAVTKDAGRVAGLTSRARRSDHALEAVYDHSTRNWDIYGAYSDFGKDFRADLGFITQVDTRRWESGSSWTWHGDATRLYNRIQISGNYDQTEERTGALWEREYEAYISFNGGKESFAQWGGGHRTRAFNGVLFDQMFQSVRGEIRPSRNVFAGASVSAGDWIDFTHTRAAEQRTLRPYLTLNYGRHLTVRYTHIYDVLDVGGGRLFSAHVPEFRIVYQQDTRTLFRAIVQYTDIGRDRALYRDPIDRLSRDLFAQLLFSYKINPQTALYFGYVDGSHGSEDYALTHANRTLFVKTSYAWLR